MAFTRVASGATENSAMMTKHPLKSRWLGPKNLSGKKQMLGSSPFGARACGYPH